MREIVPIPGWHHFHLNLPAELVTYLQSGYKPDSKYPNTFKPVSYDSSLSYQANSEKLVQDNEWNPHIVEFTDLGKVILGTLSLPKFASWFRAKLKERVDDLQLQLRNDTTHKAWLDIECFRQQSILSSTLYFVQIELGSGEVLYKIGRTSRPIEQRLVEIKADVARETSQAVKNIKVLKNIPNAGYVEKYLLHRYAKFKLPLGKLTEYLQLDLKSLRTAKSELTRFEKARSEFDSNERCIATGRWKWEAARRKAISRGAKATIREGGNFGRPKGSGLSNTELLERHADIVQLVQSHSLTETARLSGKSLATVKRVKATMKDVGVL
jgi:hypothetical protein